MKLKTFFLHLLFLLLVTTANALTLTEDFEAAFPTWESGWLGVNSDLRNYYGVGAGRGNNPDGLWIGDATITFNQSFGQSLTSLALDVASFTPYTLLVYDSSNFLIYTSDFILPNDGALTDPGVYDHFSISSSDGISKFSFLPIDAVAGDLSIDNVSVTTVPEPATLLLFGMGLSGFGLWIRRRSAH